MVCYGDDVPWAPCIVDMVTVAISLRDIFVEAGDRVLPRLRGEDCDCGLAIGLCVYISSRDLLDLYKGMEFREVADDRPLSCFSVCEILRQSFGNSSIHQVVHRMEANSWQ